MERLFKLPWRSVLILLSLFLAAGCGSSGYNSSYIISHQEPDPAPEIKE